MVSQKHLIFDHNIGECRPIVKILSKAEIAKEISYASYDQNCADF